MEKSTKDINFVIKLIKRIAFDWILLFGVYLPFGLMVMFASIGNEWVSRFGGFGPKMSISTMGWKLGHYWVLAFYTLFLIGFFIYQTRLLTKISGKKQKLINWMTWIGSAFMFIGSCLPVDDSLYLYGASGQTAWDLLHCIFCQIGTALLLLTVILIVIACCRETKAKKALYIVPMCLIVALMGSVILFDFIKTGKFTIFVSSFFELWCTFAVMIFMHYLTLNYEIAEKVDTKQLQENKAA